MNCFIMYKNGQKGTVIYEKYIHVYIQITRLLLISVGSIDIKESGLVYLNVGGTVAACGFLINRSDKTYRQMIINIKV